MRVYCLATVLWLASAPAHAGRFLAAPVRPFVPNYLTSISMSLQREPMFAGNLLKQFDVHLGRIVVMRQPQEVVEYLRDEVLNRGGGVRTTVEKASAVLGKASLDARTASAILLANSLTHPDQTVEVLAGMERMRTAWGQRAAHLLKSVDQAPGRSPRFVELLGSIGSKIKPLPHNTTYDSFGRLRNVFDGSR